MATVLPNLIAFDRECLLFAKEETTFGTEIKPTAADQVLIAGDGSMSQARGYITDAQRRDTLSQITRIAGRFEPGTCSLPVYLKPSGVLGTKPEGAALLKALFGREVVTASTKVEYFLLRLIDTRPGLTLWLKKGHTVFRGIGCIINEGRFPLRAGNQDDAVGQVAYSGLIGEVRWTGTDELAANAASAATSLTVKDAKKFTVGSYIKVAANDNGGAGYQVTAVNIGSNLLTITPGLTGAQSTDDVVSPWLPTGSELGSPVHGRLGLATRGGVTLPLTGGEMVLRNNIKFLNEEKNGLDFPTRFVHGQARQVDVNAEVYFDANQSRFFHDAQQTVRADVAFPWGNTPAFRYTLTAKNVEINPPELSGNEEKILRLNGQAFASAIFDDELVMLFN